MSRFGLAISVFAGSLFGCSFSPGTPGGQSSGGGGSLGLGGNVGTGGAGASAAGGSNATGTGNSSGTGSGGDVGITGAAGGCGQANVSVSVIPPDILIVQDKSGSMNNDDSDSSCKGGCGSNSKWSQVTTALSQVVMNTQASINWGLKFFADGQNECGVNPGVAVPVAPNNASAVSAAYSGTGPSSATPTRAALNVSVTYMQTLTDSNPKYLLIATDGEPNCPAGCSGTTCTNTPNPTEEMGTEQAVSDAVAAGFKVFVVGIGNVSSAVTTLNQMAINGGEAQTGTTSYFAATDPTTLETALNAIVGVVASCTISLVSAPSGFTNVAVSAATSSGIIEIPNDPTNGWSYGPNMQSINLNGTSCMNLKSGTYSNFQFYYACPGTTIHIGAVLPR
jgi:hypothetical protein